MANDRTRPEDDAEAAAPLPAEPSAEDAAPPGPTKGAPAVPPAVSLPAEVAAPVAAVAPTPPLAQAVPAMSIPPEGPPPQVEERLRRLEQVLRNLEEMQRQQPRPVEGGILPTEPAPAAKGPSWLGRAAAWFSGSSLLARAVDFAKPGDATAAPRWFLLECVADARAIVRMYTDPRYRLTWMGRLVPPALLLAFLTVRLWLPYLLPCIGALLLNVPGLGWALERIVELLITFVLFRTLGQEARRYRETAPDLPPSLRL